MRSRGGRSERTRREASDPLAYIQRLVRTGDYLLARHVQAGLEEGEYSLDDIECSILGGSIVRNERDEKGDAVDGRKYVIDGPDVGGLAFETVGKVIEWLGGRRYFLISAYGKH